VSIAWLASYGLSGPAQKYPLQEVQNLWGA